MTNLDGYLRDRYYARQWVSSVARDVDYMTKGVIERMIQDAMEPPRRKPATRRDDPGNDNPGLEGKTGPEKK